MLERERQVEIIVSEWPAPAPGEQAQTQAVIPALGRLIAQFESLAATHPETDMATTALLARATLHDLALVSVISTLPRVPAPRVALATATNAGSSATPLASGHGRDIGSDSSQRLDAPKRLSAPAPAASAASTTVLAEPPTAVAAAASGGATASIAPFAATLVLAAARVLGTRQLGRPAMDPVSWRSATLTLRLERPG